MAGANTLNFDDANFEQEVLQSDGPVLVDFWAEWCGPCQLVGPVIDKIADDYTGKVKVGKVDVDKAPQTAAKFGVQSIPTVLLFDKGQPVEKLVGAKQEKDYKAVLDAKLAVG